MKTMYLCYEMHLCYDTIMMTVDSVFKTKKSIIYNCNNRKKTIYIWFSLQIQKVHFWLNTFKKLDLFRFEKQMGRTGIYHT